MFAVFRKIQRQGLARGKAVRKGDVGWSCMGRGECGEEVALMGVR